MRHSVGGLIIALLLPLSTGSGADRNWRTLKSDKTVAKSISNGIRFAGLSYRFHRLAIWDSNTGKRVWLASGDIVEGSMVTVVSPGNDVVATSQYFSKSGKGPSLVTLWDVKSRKPLHVFKGDRLYSLSLAFSPDGRRLAASCWDNNARLWDVKTGKQLAVLGHGHIVDCVAFSPDGKQVASGGADKTIKLWDAATGNLKATLPGSQASVTSVRFSPDSRLLASGSWDGRVTIWDAQSGRKIRVWPRSDKEILFLAFSPNGKQLAVASVIGGLKTYSMPDGVELRKMEKSKDGVGSPKFTSDGKRLISLATRDGNRFLFVWNTRTGKLLRQIAVE